jgi:hypothetical protein
VGRAGALAAAEEVSYHVWQWAHSAMECVLVVLAVGERAVVVWAGSNRISAGKTHGSRSASTTACGAGLRN